MASKIDICNLALSHLGDEAAVSSIDPPDGSPQAALCARFYPVALSMMLERHPWHFALARAALASVDNDMAEAWAYAYALPSDMVRALKVYADGSDSVQYAYIIEGQTLYTSLDAAYLQYIRAQTDTTRFSPGFTHALALLLACLLVGPLTKDPSRYGEYRKVYELEFSRAAALDANEQRVDREHTPDWIKARA